MISTKLAFIFVFVISALILKITKIILFPSSDHLLTNFKLPKPFPVTRSPPCKRDDYFVISQGGVGSTNFMQLTFGDKTNDLNNADGIKHLSANHFAFASQLTAQPQKAQGRCATAKRALVIIGDQNHTLHSVVRRFKAEHINMLRRNMGKAQLPPLTRQQILALPESELGIEYFRSSWFARRESPLVRVVTTEELYSDTEGHLEWLRH